MSTGTSGPGIKDGGEGGWRRAKEGVGGGCPQCGSGNTDVIEGIEDTGVSAPDGGRETRRVRCVVCRDCGEYEEF